MFDDFDIGPQCEEFYTEEEYLAEVFDEDMASQSSGLRCSPLKAETQVRILLKSLPSYQGQ